MRRVWLQVDCPFHTEWVQGRATTDARAHAANFVPTTRTWSNSTFVAGATACGIAPAAADEMVEEMFGRCAHRSKHAIVEPSDRGRRAPHRRLTRRRYVERVAQAPADHAMDYVHSYLHVAKE